MVDMVQKVDTDFFAGPRVGGQHFKSSDFCVFSIGDGIGTTVNASCSIINLRNIDFVTQFTIKRSILRNLQDIARNPPHSHVITFVLPKISIKVFSIRDPQRCITNIISI